MRQLRQEGAVTGRPGDCASYLLASLAVLSCSSAEDPTGPSLTAAAVTVAVETTGSDLPASYTISLDDGMPRPIDANGSVSFGSVEAGAHSAALDGVPSHCVVAGTNPRSFTVTQGQGVEVTFVVTCGTAFGAIVVTTATLGTNLDPDGYSVAVEAPPGTPAGSIGDPIEPAAIGLDDVTTFSGVSVGDYAVRLKGVAPNCAARGANPVGTTVTAATVSTVAFTVDCHADAGALELTTVTTGVDLDPDGYTALVDEDDVHPIGSNDVILIGGLATGMHSVRLAGVAAHCTVEGPSPVEFAVAADETTALAITIECGESGNAPPGVTISSPDTSRTFVPLTVPPGTPVTFTGSAVDPEDGALTGAALSWTSNVDGELGIGESISIASLSEGMHTVTLTATDSGGGSGTESVLVVVVSPPGPGYQIKLRLAEGLHLAPEERTTIEAVLARLETVVVGDIPDVPFASSGFTCGAKIPPIDETIDDVLLYLAIEPIDGPGGVLGAAAACIQREGSRLPALGGMVFDSADLPELVAAGLLEELVLHEAMHVMGFGTTWRGLDLLEDASDPNRGGTPGNDTHFSGAEAVAQFLAIGGDEYTGGNVVPVENDTEAFSSGSLDSHWRESVFEHEIMTPVLNKSAPANPLSVMTIGQFRDLGYEVDLAAADPYTRDFSQLGVLAADPPPADRTFHLKDDILDAAPLWLVDPDGKTRRVR